MKKVRVSTGSAIVLGLQKGCLDAEPTTAYLLTYRKGKCTANCGFCSQAKSSGSRADMLSRVAWPVFAVRKVAASLANSARNKKIERICIQALNYPGVLDDVLVLAERIKAQGTQLPMSVSCQPLTKEEMIRLHEAGVERIGIALDAATKEIFEKVKGSSAGGPYRWRNHRQALMEAVQIFGERHVSTHLIVGLGEKEEDMIRTFQWCVDHGVHPALFSFTPIPGTRLEHRCSPRIDQYRRIQLARHFIVQGKTRYETMLFNEHGRIIHFGVSEDELENASRTGKPFLTSGCPSCNRPYYNEKPSGPLYNFPAKPSSLEIETILKQLRRET
jgi:biotin synthase-related radical SAM superfamily protein